MLDSALGGGLASGAPDVLRFYSFWLLPFVVASLFLGWYAARGGREGVRHAARRGCLAALLAGGTAALLAFVAHLLLSGDALGGAVAALVHAPLVATVGLVAGAAGTAMRNRRS